MKKHKTSHFLALIGFGMIVIIWVIFMFWSIYPYKTTVNKQPYKVINKVVKQGDLLLYEMDYCKYTNIIPTVHRQFIDGIIYSTPESTAQLKKGCGIIINSVRVPITLPPGDYYMKAVVTFQVNPIRTISKEFLTEQFKVIK